MSRTAVMLVVIFFALVVMSGCGDSNPYIGEWKLDQRSSPYWQIMFAGGMPIAESHITIEFTEKQLLIRLNGELQRTFSIMYSNMKGADMLLA